MFPKHLLCLFHRHSSAPSVESRTDRRLWPRHRKGKRFVEPADPNALYTDGRNTFNTFNETRLVQHDDQCSLNQGHCGQLSISDVSSQEGRQEELDTGIEITTWDIDILDDDDCHLYFRMHFANSDAMLYEGSQVVNVVHDLVEFDGRAIFYLRSGNNNGTIVPAADILNHLEGILEDAASF